MKYAVTLASLAVALFVGIQVYQFALERAENKNTAPEPQPMAVEIMQPGKRAVEDRADLVGVLEAGAQVQLVSRTSGYITGLPFDVGDMVRAGEVVVKLDDSQQRENVSAAKALLTIAEAQLRAKQAEVDLNERVVARERKLAQANATTQQQLEAAEGQLLVSQANLDLEKARVSEALSRLEQTQLLLKEMQILAPTTGLVAERFVDVGDLAKNDVPLMRLVEIDVVNTFVHVVERDYPRINVDQTALVETDAFPGRLFHGRIVRKAPVINPNTGTAAVQIEIPNDQRLLKPGMHARASILFQRRADVTVIPASALLENQRFPAVMVVSGDPPTVEMREVEVGVNDGRIVEIVAGLEPGQRVVTLGSRMIKPGQLVRPTEVAWPTELLAEGPGTDSLIGAAMAAE